MGKKKSLNIMGIVFLAVAVVALVLAIVGMVTPAFVSKEVLGNTVSVKLFGNDEKTWNWEVMTKAQGASPTLSIVGFIVAIVGAVVVIAHSAIKTFAGKNIGFLGFIGACAALVGGILILVGGLVMVNKLNTVELLGTVTKTDVYSISVGTILGLISGIVAAAAGVLGSLLVKD